MRLLRHGKSGLAMTGEMKNGKWGMIKCNGELSLNGRKFKDN